MLYLALAFPVPRAAVPSLFMKGREVQEGGISLPGCGYILRAGITGFGPPKDAGIKAVSLGRGIDKIASVNDL